MVYILLFIHLGYNAAKKNIAILKLNPTQPNQTKPN